MLVKRVISFSEETLEALKERVPKSQRSKFVNSAVVSALRQVAKEKAIDALENHQKTDSSGDSVVETLREIRSKESNRLTNE